MRTIFYRGLEVFKKFITFLIERVSRYFLNVIILRRPTSGVVFVAWCTTEGSYFTLSAIHATLSNITKDLKKELCVYIYTYKFISRDISFNKWPYYLPEYFSRHSFLAVFFFLLPLCRLTAVYVYKVRTSRCSVAYNSGGIRDPLNELLSVTYRSFMELM